jgi:S1-C subfamily serine protease
VSWVDAVVVLWIVLSAVIGFQRGLTAQIVSLAGLAVGAFLGAKLGPVFLPGGSDSPWVPVASLIGALVGALLLQTAASILGGRLRKGLSAVAPLKVADGLGGIAIGAGLGLAVAWLTAVAALQLDRPALSSTVRNSAILSGLVEAVPPRAVLRTLARLDPLPLITAPPDLRLPPPDPSVLETPVRAVAGESVVKIETVGCGVGVQGSGWVAMRELVVTNVHVVTGADDIQVAAQNGQILPATVVYVDPADDVAVLLVDGLETPPLRLARRSPVEDPVVFLGYPRDGGLTAVAGVAGHPTKVFAADAYGRRARLRTVVPLRGTVQRGDSGGPVVNETGRVVAMMFAASTDGGGGFGVPASEIDDALPSQLAPVEPGPCPG